MRKKWKFLFFLYLMLYCKKKCHTCPKELIRQFFLHIDSRVRFSGRAKGWEWQICHPRHEFSVIASSLAILLSLRGAKRRSNPEKERACTRLLRYARNESYALRTYQVLLCKTCGNTGELIATIFLAKISQWVARIRVLTEFCFAKLAAMTGCR